MKYQHEVRIIKIAKFIFHPAVVALPSFFILGLWESVVVASIILSWALYDIEIIDCNEEKRKF